ncbi:MAG TPA: acyl-CoA dehydratase activase [Ignavibacteria bacterium]|nr:acyl-CoA dehydratase activase [Ignavibacteria bacterium]
MIKASVGICIGASSISIVRAHRETESIQIEDVKIIPHEGNPRKILEDFFSDSVNEGVNVTVTGRKFRYLVNAESISEPEALEEALAYLKLNGKCDAVASLGGENFIVYCINNSGGIDNVLSGNKCASGTGEFFLQQIRRMNLGLDQALCLANEEKYYTVSGRCSVFCKSDCTHALNKGVEKGLVVSGLCKMIADKTIELLAKQKSGKVLLIGGVSRNKTVVRFIKEKYPESLVIPESPYFEALGAAVKGLKKGNHIDQNNIFRENEKTFSELAPLSSAEERVIFKSMVKADPLPGDECVLGLDVGSTTTKAVIIRVRDSALIADTYLRTNGNPVQASVNCYMALREQLSVPLTITGLGTTGSGRHISALHAMTHGVVNEIIAHAVAAAHFDKDVDTIFEIGGQDAKYTHLTNGIASDYAMNEACSAGTGSFLEESAKETLNISYTDIAEIALKADSPLNFNDQCAAFISSDIKTASHEGAARENIVAGLVYSICMNYVNRVKGNRPTGKKIFMQGGVCYNRAVPYAMSNLVDKQIIVPPEPGLMGAFGVALEVMNRINLGFLDKGSFVLNELIERKFGHVKDFICQGGSERCDRKCKIAVIKVGDKKYPFGGACSKYYNKRTNTGSEPGKYNYVRLRQNMVFENHGIINDPDEMNYSGKLYSGEKSSKQILRSSVLNDNQPSIGIIKSFQVNTLFPLYSKFFTLLGFNILLPDSIDSEGMDKMSSSFCYPVEIAYGMFQNLVKKKPDYIFMPHITEMDYDNGHKYKRLCVFVQGESYYLRSAYSDEKIPPVISPILNFKDKRENVRKAFRGIALQLGRPASLGEYAFDEAWKQFTDMQANYKLLGRRALAELESDPTKFGIVLFGRPYNAFAPEANLNIPHKFASKNIVVIPHDFLPNEKYHSYDNMYWYSGQQILRSARFTKEHDQLFGVYVTNFSCGPDSFLLSYFRNIMGTKPSLTLELDSHSADVGVDTRIDAALDIIRNYVELKKQGLIEEKPAGEAPLSIISRNKRTLIVDSERKEHELTSPEIEIVIPSMGKFSTEAFSAICRSAGMNSSSLPIPTAETLKSGRGNTSCKECLPFILTTGSLVEYCSDRNCIGDEKLKNNSRSIIKNGKKVLFFMPHGYGPCRQGQYYISLKDIITNLKLKDIGILSMDDEASFEDLGTDFFIKGWLAISIADVIHDIESVIQSLAVNKLAALDILYDEWSKILLALETENRKGIFRQLKVSAQKLALVKLKKPVEEAKVISLIGEIYVRKEQFSRGELVKTLVERGFVVRTAPISEYVYYSNYLIKNGIVESNDLKGRLQIAIKDKYQRYFEKKIKNIFSITGLFKPEMVDIEKTIDYAGGLISDKLVGETILTTGLALRDILDEACGVISIGPFNCMPSRLSEAILNKEMTLEGKYKNGKLKRNGYPEDLSSLPFLYIETDGNPFPQITQSRLEIFMLQAEKLHKAMKLHKQPVITAI